MPKPLPEGFAQVEKQKEQVFVSKNSGRRGSLTMWRTAITT
ncbi:MAG: hypothetical protein ACYTEQ_30015 [Planctomycetota bacterium]|jgi:hypothetical protein